MANYDLIYPGQTIDQLLTTAYYLKNAGYIFLGSASSYSGTPTQRAWLIAPSGFTGFGFAEPIPIGSMGICLFNGTSWSGVTINVVTVDENMTAGSDNPISSGAVYDVLSTITQGISAQLDSLELADATDPSDILDVLTVALKMTRGGFNVVVSSLDILSATASKAGLMSAADKIKLDGFVNNIRSMVFADSTPSSDLGTKIVESLKWTVDNVQEVITTLTLLAASTEKAGLMSASDKAYVDGLPSTLGNLTSALQDMLASILSIVFDDTTPSSDKANKIVETMKWTSGGIQRAITTLTILAASTEKAGLMSAADKAYVDGLPATLNSLSNSISSIRTDLLNYYSKTEVNTLLDGKQDVIDDLAAIRSGAAAGATAVQPADMNSAISSVRASIGYYECSTAAGTAAKTVSASGYTLTNGGCIRIKMANANTANNVTLNINSTGAKALYYNGEQASVTNTWEAGEVLEIYYDGENYNCVSGGGGKFATGEAVNEVGITNSYETGSDDDLLTKEALTDVLYGEPVENTGTWGNWRHSSTLERIFIISDQLSVFGGTISVSLNDYSTYRLGIVIQRGTEWTSTVISDTGWKTADTTKVIAANEVGYNIKVSLSRIDNGTINPSDANTIIRSLSYTYMSGGSSGVMRSIDDIYAKMGYYICETASATSAKIVSADGYKLATGGNIRIKMSNDNTADNVTLNINGTGTKALYYDGEQATASNSWNAGEVLEVYYDGTQYQCMSISKLQRDIDVLDDAVFGVPTEQTGTWGAWQSAVSPPNNMQRIFTICNQRAVQNGIVIVSLNDYTTYKFGIVIANGVTWSSTVITDTGWLTRDTTKTISQSEDGYYLRIALARVDNGAISPSDAASIINQLSYTFVEGTEGIMMNYTRIGTFANTSNLPCSSSNTSKLTVECTSENNYKVTCISKQALVYGYIGLPSSLEAGKKYRLMFHCISDNYNSASIALSNSNGSTSMIVSNVQKMDGDFVLDFVYETNRPYLRFFCNDMQTGSSIIIENLRIVPTESLNAVQEVVKETIPQSSFVYASTRKLDFTNKHRNIYPCSYSHPSWTLPSAQCLAIYNKYFIRIAADGKLTISQLSNDTMTTIYTSEQNLAGHNNSAQFAPFLQQGQTFPYLYVSALNRTGGPICKVYEITTSSVTLVQTITFNLPETILPTMSSYSTNSQIGDDGCLYLFSTEIGVIKMVTPNVSAGDVVLGLESVLDYFRFAYDYSTFIWQGGKIYNGMLIMPIGGGNNIQVRSIFVFDLSEHKIIAAIGANTAWSSEVEDCDLLDGKLCTVSITGTEVTIWDFDVP